jgi:hypothetical protein
MNKLKITVTVLGCVFTFAAQAKEYVGFDLCGNTDIQTIKNIAGQHNTSNVSEIVRNWSANDVIVLIEQYSVGNELYYIDLQLYKGKLVAVGIKAPGKLLDYITAKYGNNYAKITEDQNGGISSKNYFFNIKEDPSAQIVFTANKIGASGDPYYYLAYHCTDLYKQYKVDKDTYQKKLDLNKANDLGL